MAPGLRDTSVVIDWHDPAVVEALPDQMAISRSLRPSWPQVHLAAGPAERARRQARPQEVEAKLAPLGFDGAAVRSYGLVVAALVREGREPRSRFADLLVAATAHANGLDLYTRNGDDYLGLEELVHVVAI